MVTSQKKQMIDLYPHNQEAYNKVKKIFESVDKTCIVHATGTGKSLIAAKLIFDNPKAKYLFVAPTIFIFKEIKKHIKGYKYNIQFRTYSSFLNKPLNSFSGYDYIILDEFHRIGAKQWGEAIKTILDQNSKSKVLGLSATHIRFLDDNRNMAEEFFDNNIASYLSLGEAIEKEIHKVPTYVSALYNIKEILDKSQLRLIKKNKEKEIERLKSNRIIWEESNGVDFILKKYLSNKRKKILVFCKDVKHIDFIKSLIVQPFKEIFQNNIDFHTIYSAMGIKETLKIFNQFESKYNTQVLFCVDMLNEGIHVHNVDTILMFRDTVSPIIYFQQIGRCFAVGQKQNPLIFDFVNNFNIKNSVLNIQQNFYQDFNNSNSTDFYRSRDTILDFYDESLDFQNFIKSFDLGLKTFEECLEEYKNFIEFYKRVPKSSEMNWVSRMKQFFNYGKLSQKQINAILKVNPNFFQKMIKSFEDSLNEYKEFYQINKRFPIEKEMNWITRMKFNFNYGKLSQEHINAILKVNPKFFEKKYKSFEDSLNEYQKFYQINKRFPTQNEMKWIQKMRKEFKKETLSQKHINAILKVNPNFFQKMIKSFEDSLNEYKEFYQINKKFPTQKEMNWIQKMRKEFKKETLSQKHINAILKVDPNFFQKIIKSFEDSLNEYKEFYQINKKFPTQKEMNWVKYTKQNFLYKKISQEQINAILKVNPKFFENIRINKTFEESLNEYQKFYQINKRFPIEKEMYSITNIRRNYRNGKLTQEQINAILKVNPNFFQKMIKSFEDSLNEYKEFYQINKKFPTQKEMNWIQKMRKEFKKETLSQKHINAILKVDPNFFKKTNKSFEESLNEYQKFYQINKRFPTQNEMKWISYTKYNFKNKILSQKQINTILKINPNFF